jgi:hypothetical protein
MYESGLHNMNRKIILVIPLMLALIFTNITHTVHSNTKDWVVAYILMMACTVAHEVGHASAIQVLHDQSSSIHVGAFSSGSDTLFRVGGIQFKFPLLPYGYVEYTSYGKDPLKDMVVALSGPVAGSVASYICLTLLEKVCPNGYYRSKACMANGVIVHMLNLIPHPGFDGHYLYMALKKYLSLNKISVPSLYAIINTCRTRWCTTISTPHR